VLARPPLPIWMPPDTLPVAIICFMEIASFTIEFFEHVPLGNLKSSLELCSNRGASIERHTDRIFRVVCTEPKQLSFVGRLLFSPALSRICRVTSTSGVGEARASAYDARKTGIAVTCWLSTGFRSNLLKTRLQGHFSTCKFGVITEP
jgi:hypothetical protein